MGAGTPLPASAPFLGDDGPPLKLARGCLPAEHLCTNTCTNTNPQMTVMAKSAQERVLPPPASAVVRSSRPSPTPTHPAVQEEQSPVAMDIDEDLIANVTVPLPPSEGDVVRDLLQHSTQSAPSETDAPSNCLIPSDPPGSQRDTDPHSTTPRPGVVLHFEAVSKGGGVVSAPESGAEEGPSVQAPFAAPAVASAALSGFTSSERSPAELPLDLGTSPQGSVEIAPSAQGMASGHALSASLQLAGPPPSLPLPPVAREWLVIEPFAGVAVTSDELCSLPGFSLGGFIERDRPAFEALAKATPSTCSTSQRFS